MVLPKSAKSVVIGESREGNLPPALIGSDNEVPRPKLARLINKEGNWIQPNGWYFQDLRVLKKENGWR